MPRIAPFLWFDTEALEAAELYCSVFPNSQIVQVSRYGAAGPREEGLVMTVTFELDGQRVTALNGGPQHPFTEAVSLFVDCDGQEEVDRYWDALVVDGGREVACGWLRDKYGLAWQIVPKQLTELLSDADDGRRERANAAMLQMVKIDVADLQRAADGVGVS